MAKKAQVKSQAVKAVTPETLPPAPAIDTPSGDGLYPSPVDVAPAEVLGSFPPQEPASAEPVNQPENTTGLIEPPAEETPQADSNQPTAETTNPPADSTIVDEGAGAAHGSGDDSSPIKADDSSALPNPPADSTHPAIALAQRHHTGAGAPREGAPRYLTPPPFDVFAKRKQ